MFVKREGRLWRKRNGRCLNWEERIYLLSEKFWMFIVGILRTIFQNHDANEHPRSN